MGDFSSSTQISRVERMLVSFRSHGATSFPTIRRGATPICAFSRSTSATLPEIGRPCTPGRSSSAFSTTLVSPHLHLLAKCQPSGEIVQEWPKTVIVVGMLVLTLCCLGLKNVHIETDLVKLWVEGELGIPTRPYPTARLQRAVVWTRKCRTSQVLKPLTIHLISRRPGTSGRTTRPTTYGQSKPQ